MMTAGWKKSSYSNGEGGNCVEARGCGRDTDVRDTQNREAGYLSFKAQEWAALVSSLRAN